MPSHAGPSHATPRHAPPQVNSEPVGNTVFLFSVYEETLNLYTSGSNDPQYITCNKVKLRLSNIKNGQSIDLVILETSLVCFSIMRVVGEELCRELELKGMQLVDTVVCGMDSGVLIRGDHYWEIECGKLECLSESMVRQ